MPARSRRPLPKPETRGAARQAGEMPSWAGASAPTEAADGVFTPPLAKRSKRGRQWEARQREAGRVAATYRLPVELRGKITDTAHSRSVTVDDLVRALLQYALDQYESGALVLNPRPREGKFTL